MEQQIEKIYQTVWSLIPSSELTGSWYEEFRNHNFSQAAQLLEQYFSSEKLSYEARLWWILCQSEIGVVPATALSAPLMENLEGDKYLDLVCCLLLKLSLDLYQRKHVRLGLALFEKALVYFERLEKLSYQERQAIDKFWLQLVQDEISRAESKREDRKYISRLKNKLLELESKNKVSEKKSILVQESGQKRKSNFVFGTLIVGCIAITFLVFYLKRQSQPFEDQRLVMITEPPLNFNSLLPTLLPSLGENQDLNGDKNNSDQLFEKLKKRLEVNNNVVTEEIPIKRVSEVSAKVIEEQTQVVAPEPVLPEPIPSLAQKEKEHITAQQIESLDQKNNAPEAVTHVGKSGNVYQIPVNAAQDNKNDQSATEGKLSDPEIPYGVEVKHFPAPVLYRTITDTEVLSSPSLLANSLARLESGSKVQAIAKMGRWLEIKSVKGNRGYVYSQDVILEPQN